MPNILFIIDVVAKYIYFEQGKEPTPEDIVRSEIVEGRIREGFVRIRQLLVRHSIFAIAIYIYTGNVITIRSRS